MSAIDEYDDKEGEYIVYFLYNSSCFLVESKEQLFFYIFHP